MIWNKIGVFAPKKRFYALYLTQERGIIKIYVLASSAGHSGRVSDALS